MHVDRHGSPNTQLGDRVEQFCSRWMERIDAWILPARRGGADTRLRRLTQQIFDATGDTIADRAIQRAGNAFGGMVGRHPEALAATLGLLAVELLPAGQAGEQSRADRTGSLVGAFAAGFLAHPQPADTTNITPEEGSVVPSEARHMSDHGAVAATAVPDSTLDPLLLAIPDLLYHVRHDGVIIQAKPSRDDPFPEQQVAGKHLSDVLPPPEAEHATRLIEAALESHTVQEMEFSVRIDGREHDREARIVPYSAGEALLVVRDTSERKRAEATLLQARLYESLSALSAGIAHVFNNRLMAISGQAELARSELPPDSLVYGRMTQIELSVQLASELVTQILTYGGGGMSSPQPVALPSLLQELTPQLTRLSVRRAALRLEVDDDVPAVEGDAEQLRQAVLLLAANAIEAIDSDGEVRISVAKRAADSSKAAPSELLSDRQDDQHVVLEITDTGPGMDAATRARMFEPFFTTKTRGGGLSLAVVVGIVHSHGGTMEVDSDSGYGTSVRVVLPPARKASAGSAD